MLSKAFQKAVEVIDILELNGYEAYFVGGCVRDLLLHRNIKDIDIATAASPKVVQELFEKVIPVGIEHGTVIVRLKGVSYEVTTFRQDGTYSDQRHPDNVIFMNSIEEDLKRRDFTINALAMNRDGEIVDLFDGKKDIQQKIIRSVGNSKERFLEDPLRIIRALRFSSQLGFCIEEETLKQMKKLNKEIKTVAVERLTNEFTKLFQGGYIEKGINYLLEIEGHRFVPILKENDHLVTQIPRLSSPFYSFAEVITLFHYLDPKITISNWVLAWKCSNRVKKEAINLFEGLTYFERNGIDPWLMYRLNRLNFDSFIHLVEVIFEKTNIQLEQLYKQKENLAIQTRNDLRINGHDLQDLFPERSQGPWMKEIIEQVEYEVVMNRLQNKTQVIKEWILCHPPEIN